MTVNISDLGLRFYGWPYPPLRYAPYAAFCTNPLQMHSHPADATALMRFLFTSERTHTHTRVKLGSFKQHVDMVCII